MNMHTTLNTAHVLGEMTDLIPTAEDIMTAYHRWLDALAREQQIASNGGDRDAEMTAAQDDECNAVWDLIRAQSKLGYHLEF